MPITTLNSTMLSLRMQLNSNTDTLSKVLERMSSGLRINHASDGAAQVVLSSKLNTRISGMDIAQNNVQQAISMLNYADSSLSNLLGITNRIRDLSLQAMNGTYSDDERKAMQDEVEALTKELHRQKDGAKFNNTKIFEEEAVNPPPLSSDTNSYSLAKNTYSAYALQTMSLDSADEVETISEVNSVEETQKPYKVELEYIESTGSEYIDTGINANFGVSCDMDIYLSKEPTGEMCMLGSRDASKKRVSFVAFKGDKWAYGYNGMYTSSSSVVLNEKINVKSESLDKSQRVDICYGEVKETVINQGSSRHHNTDLPMYLFAMNYNGTASNKMPEGTRLYACKIYENGVLARDYIPVLDNDGIACLYDKVSGELFYDVNGNSFAYDPNVEIPPDPDTGDGGETGGGETTDPDGGTETPDPGGGTDPGSGENPNPDPEPPEPDPDPPDTGPPKRGLAIQVGSQAGIDNTIRMNLGFTLDDIDFNVSTAKNAEETLCAVEKLQETLLSKYSQIGATQNRLEGILELQNNEIINLKNANSIIKDSDIALESVNFAKAQILGQVTTSLMSQCNKQSSNLALKLINFNKYSTNLIYSFSV